MSDRSGQETVSQSDGTAGSQPLTSLSPVSGWANGLSAEASQLLQSITLSIGESPDFDSALEKFLRQVCTVTSWTMGEVWLPNLGDRKLVCSPIWYSRNPDQLRSFRQVSEALMFGQGEGLPGRIWATKQPEWNPDVSLQPEMIFWRSAAAKSAGLKAGFGVPILIKDRVLAILVFFMEEARQEDQQLVDLVLAIAAQLGTVMQLKQTEAALSESQRRLTSLIDALPGIVFSAANDPDWSMTYLSEGCWKLTGYTSQELVGSDRKVTYNDITHPDDLPTVLQVIGQAIAQRQPYVVEYRIRTCTGEEKWLWEKGNGIVNSDGEVIGLEGFITDITERKRVEDALRQSETWFRTVFESAAIGIGLTNLDGTLLESNPAAQSMFGYSPEEFRNLHFTAYTHPDDISVDQALYQKLLEGQKDYYQIEKRYIRKTGDVFWGRLTVSAIRDASGVPQFTFGMVEDITERKQAERALQEKEALLRLILNNIPQHIFWKDKNLIYQGGNRIWAVHLGFEDPAELVGKTDYDLWPVSQAENYRQSDRYVIENDVPKLHTVCRKVLSGNQEAWQDVSKVPIHDADGQVIGILGTLEDITERKRAEEALRQSESLYRLLAEHATDLISRHTADGIFWYVSPACRSLLGYEPDELIGETAFEFVHPQDLRKVRSLYKRLLRSPVTKAPLFCYRIRCKDGRYIWFETTGKAVYHPETGEVQEIIAVSRDISERKQAEQLLAEQKQALEMIATGAPLSQILKLLIQTVEEQAVGMLGSIQLVDADSCHLKYGEAPSLPSAYVEASCRVAIGPCAGSCGTAAYRRQPVIVADIANDPLWAQTRQLALSHDLRACWSVPIQSSQGELLGTFSLYYRQPRSPDVKERQLIETAAQLAGIAIERQRSEDALRRAESKYRSIFENAVEGIFQTTAEGRYLTVNPMLARIYGYDSSEELIISLTDIEHQLYVHPQRRLDFINQMREHGAVWGFESEIYQRDGSIIWISECARSLHDDQGRLIGYEGTVEDITQRKQAEVELHKRDSLLQGVAAATNCLLTNSDCNAAIPEGLAILGQAAGVDRVYIYENHPHPETQEMLMSMRYEWTREPVPPSITQSHWQNQSYSRFGMLRWYTDFTSGSSVKGIVREFPISERELLQRDGILSLLMVPIFIDDQLWGFIGFDDCYVERNWSGSEESILVAIAASIGGAIKRQRTEEQMRYQAFHDALTDLPNRMLFNHRLSVALSQARRSKEMLSVMFLDLDRFKTINDTLGHAVGDQLLRQATQRLQTCLRAVDTIARWGGDEFTLLFPNIKQVEDAATIAQRISESLKPAFYLDDRELYITSSIGIAIYPQDGTDAQTLLKNADAALYRAKEQGRNNYQFYTAAINSQASELLTLDNSLHNALERNEFVVYYQPQINVVTGKVTQMEALLRWQHSQLGLVSPKTFIALAEENGLIVPIGEWVLRAACAQNKAWQRAGLPFMRIAVNLSARQFQQPNLVEMVTQILQETELEPQFLELEITETAAMRDVEFTAAILHDLRTMGVRISMDDFGTGYSSLSYLKTFPLHALKIDQSFVSDLTDNPDDAAIITAMITLGRGLNLDVVAEGVETQVQAERLRSLHCEEMQGYWFSQPLPAEDATQFLHQYWTTVAPNTGVIASF